jgi:hypothetical protein
MDSLFKLLVKRRVIGWIDFEESEFLRWLKN